MATAIATKATANGTAGDVTVTKPTGLAVGDVMIAFITSQTGGTNEETHTGPSGWTKLQDVVPDNGTVLTVWGIIATSTETAASDFAWASGGDNGNTIGTIFRITGTAGFLSLAVNVVSAAANSSDYPSPSYTGITTPAANSLLLIAGASEITDGDIDFTAYAVANNNPSWTEEYDVTYEPSGTAINLAVASATYTTAQATGNFTFTLSADGGDASGAIVAITESINATTSPAVINMTAGIQAPTPTGTATVTATVVTMTAGIQAPSASGAAPEWVNTDKSDTSPTITNPDKS